jgi:hypothetical protein
VNNFYEKAIYKSENNCGKSSFDETLQAWQSVDEPVVETVETLRGFLS